MYNVVDRRSVGRITKLIYEGKAVDVLHKISRLDRALPEEEVAAVLERLFERFGCYVDRRRKYVLCDKPIGVRCRQRGRLYWCAVEPPWFYSERPLPGCFPLSNGFLCIQKDAGVALKHFNRGDCASALAAMPGRRAEVKGWVLYMSEGEVYVCSRAVSIYRIRQECREAKRCGNLWKISKKAAIAYEIIDGRTYIVWQMPALEALQEIYKEDAHYDLAAEGGWL
jgi:hypothetical protein